MRVLVLILLAVIAFWLIRRALRRAALKKPAAPPGAVEGELVSCAQCGMHLPRAEARLAGDRVYCSDEHARLGPRQG